MIWQLHVPCYISEFGGSRLCQHDQKEFLVNILLAMLIGVVSFSESCLKVAKSLLYILATCNCGKPIKLTKSAIHNSVTSSSHASIS